ncbi:MAG: sulfotransferase, partial [Gammaproteobacteria bacterium]|nr:sulfotransferase [Gammaproteobacteria bacterium]
YGQAFECYQAANNQLHKHYFDVMQKQDSPYAPKAARAINRFFAENPQANWPKQPPPDNLPTPVFLVGFPRSGTTLLDQILSSHSQISVVEERPTLADLHAAFIGPVENLAKLNTLTDSEIRGYREKYWQAVGRETSDAPSSGIVIDKFPLNTLMLGLIYRFFPDAKVIFALRDPRDVCVSCFQQLFGMNDAMFQFLKMETAMEYYESVMSLGTRILEQNLMMQHTVHYEHVVEDLRGEAASLLSFLELEWEESVLDYQTTADKKRINTPSAEQVTQAIYRSAINKWRNYSPYLGTHLDRLSPWVKKFGYQ